MRKLTHVSFSSDDSEIAYVVSVELRLADRKIRNSSEESSALLASEFREFGASAMVWDRESILDMMADDGACLSRAAHGGVSGAVFLLPVQISVLG
ncbi:hypothetical protein [Nocardia sp. NPDC058114]|uniref:hypothetical protein n=1 Tax=Nocardia sp. NPDC058114 TaxID=3346346 RepID=UPI0036DB4556